MPLDPDVAELVRTLAETGAPALSDGTIDEARRNYDSVPKPDPDPLPHVVDLHVPGPGGEVPVRVYAAIANGGRIYEPHVAKAVLTSSGEVVREIEPRVTRVLSDTDTLDFLRTSLAAVTAEGTGSGPFAGFPLDQVPVASKTGSAQVFGNETTIAWYASFAPADDPRYAVVMMVTEGGTGSAAVGPSVRAIYEEIFGVVGTDVDPDRSVLIDGAPSADLPIVRADGTPITPGMRPSGLDAEGQDAATRSGSGFLP